MTYTKWIQLAFAYLAFSSAQIGFWALFAPQSFYDSFPGLGKSWISVDGPYNEHLIRDFGALNLALLVLFVYAAVSLSRPLVNAAAMAALVWGVPHTLYHLFNTDVLSTGDVIISLGGLLLFAGLPIVILVLAGKMDTGSGNTGANTSAAGVGAKSTT